MMLLFTETSLVFFVIGVLSMLTHGVKKWALGEIRGNLVDWYMTHPRATVLALISCLGGIATAILAGGLTDYASGIQVTAAWGIGFSADTLNNQGEKK